MKGVQILGFLSPRSTGWTSPSEIWHGTYGSTQAC